MQPTVPTVLTSHPPQIIEQVPPSAIGTNGTNNTRTSRSRSSSLISSALSFVKWSSVSPQGASLRQLEQEIKTWIKEGGKPLTVDMSSFLPTSENRESAHILYQFFSKMRETGEYLGTYGQDSETKKLLKANLQKRVCELLEQLPGNANLLGICIAQARDDLNWCGNYHTAAFLNMECAAKMCQIEFEVAEGRYDNNLGELINLAKSMYRFQLLENISDEKIKELKRTKPNFKEDNEVRLSYLIELSKEFQLFINVSTKLYPDYLKLPEIEAKRTKNLLISSHRDIDKNGHDPDFLSFLANWAPTIKFLERLDLEKIPDLRTINAEIKTRQTDIQKRRGDLEDRFENKTIHNFIYETLSKELVDEFHGIEKKVNI
jgi:hypothetical protein